MREVSYEMVCWIWITDVEVVVRIIYMAIAFWSGEAVGKSKVPLYNVLCTLNRTTHLT